MNRKRKDFFIFAGVMLFAISLELAFAALQVKDENIYLVFVLAVLTIIIETRSIRYGLLAMALMVLSFNYFITEPTYTFVVDDTNNYVSFVMFIIVTLLVNSLVIQLQRQIELSRSNENKVNALYNISSDLLYARDNNELYERIISSLARITGEKVSIVTAEGKVYGKADDASEYEEAISFAIRNRTIVDSKSGALAIKDKTILPICSEVEKYGALIVEDKDDNIYDVAFYTNVIEELVVALDKNEIRKKQEATKAQVEKEKFRASVLRGLSHDLKTPLTMIQSGSDFLRESYDGIDDQTRKQLITDIYDEACDLSDFVNNLLDLTRLENLTMSLNKSDEPVDDILVSVYEKVRRRLGGVEVKIEEADEVVMVKADVGLLSQVFINLIDNALTHTRDLTRIVIDYHKEADKVVFNVADDGGGISQERIDKIFDEFYTLGTNADRKRSHGLGLSICKAIVEAHNGTIRAYNNDIGGTTFTFTIESSDQHGQKDITD